MTLNACGDPLRSAVNPSGQFLPLGPGAARHEHWGVRTHGDPHVLFKVSGKMPGTRRRYGVRVLFHGYHSEEMDGATRTGRTGAF